MATSTRVSSPHALSAKGPAGAGLHKNLCARRPSKGAAGVRRRRRLVDVAPPGRSPKCDASDVEPGAPGRSSCSIIADADLDTGQGVKRLDSVRFGVDKSINRSIDRMKESGLGVSPRSGWLWLGLRLAFGSLVHVACRFGNAHAPSNNGRNASSRGGTRDATRRWRAMKAPDRRPTTPHPPACRVGGGEGGGRMMSVWALDRDSLSVSSCSYQYTTEPALIEIERYLAAVYVAGTLPPPHS